jgi:excinuclease ABC subunit C
VPQRGDKKALLETVARNAGEAPDPAQAAPRRRPEHAQPGAGGDRRGARHGDAPLRIECFDVSQIQGTDVVASMVVFEDGLARKSEYRRFAVGNRRAPTTWPR